MSKELYNSLQSVITNENDLYDRGIRLAVTGIDPAVSGLL